MARLCRRPSLAGRCGARARRRKTMTWTIDEYASPLGGVRFALHQGRLSGMTFSDRWARLEQALVRRLGPAARGGRAAGAPVRARLDDYFAGDLAALDALEVEPAGTDFQRAVWAALRTIPPGRTTSYGALARAI